MKCLKKLFAAVMVVAMAVTMMMPTMATETEKGSITINSIAVNDDGELGTTVYSIYKLLDLESYDTTKGTYSYKVNSAWTAFFATDDAKAYFEVDDDGYAKWKEGVNTDKVTAAGFAEKALAYAKKNGITPVKSSATEGQFVITTDAETGAVSGKFADLELGYYLIDSNVGALCGLTTTNPDAAITAKNQQPTIDKQVKEDSTGNWGDSNTADIGQTVEFRVTINVHAGAENYVLHDKMSAGLTFKEVTKVEHIEPGTATDDDVVAKDGNYVVKTEGVCDEKCTFEVEFTKEFCDDLATNDKVIVYYTAMVNRNAVIAGEGNPNTVKLEFGEDHFTTEDSTVTKTFGIDIVKTDSQNFLIDGAQFKIYDAATGGNEVAVVKWIEDGKTEAEWDGVTYRRARADETGVSIVVKDGKARVVGLDNGTYYLEETVAPDGYNKLTSRQSFTISDANHDAIFNNGVYSVDSGIQVVNKSGTMLPETGGIGTTMFYIVGGLLVVGAGVLLVTKKRMGE